MSIGIGVSFIFNKLGGGGTPPNPDFNDEGTLIL
jgi:hypothetical protein